MVMPGTNSSAPVHYWAGRYPNKIGWMFGPNSYRKSKVREWLPYALDNDAFGAWQDGREWDEAFYFKFLDWISEQPFQPMWAAVPDVVADKAKTFNNWEKYYPMVKQYGWQLGFVAQDGMTPQDIPENADVVFIGGSRNWKWRNVQKFSENFPRVHVGRVNTLYRLWRCHELGVESVDGTGWFRREENEFMKLQEYFDGIPHPQMTMDF